ncbi:uncharacterized protein LOC110721953 [Chenopodium quinoa]|uniref:uncharacterized protein LOC110721953 n=1 Tax=Chenopodium quinoa TaxID=63459 RepID=UPI000B78132B|nr:uncharacterized protein LOC110721953 [Chenopodium quinoa]
MTRDQPKEWCNYLPMEKWWYNTHFHSSAGMTPYEVLYCQAPPIHLPYLPDESANELVDRSMQKREMILKVLKENLTKAQHKEVSAIIGKVAYKVQLLSSTRIHNVFHASQLNPLRGTLRATAVQPTKLNQEAPIPSSPTCILESRSIPVSGLRTSLLKGEDMLQYEEY